MRSQVRVIGGEELGLIQAALRMDLDRDAALREAAQRPLDWPRLLRLAEFHRVLPLVYRRLRETAMDLVPRDTVRWMAARQSANEFHASQMVASLAQVTQALEGRTIPVLCLKGPTLAARLYGSPALRYFGDLDVLVPAQDCPRAQAVLEELGLLPAVPLPPTELKAPKGAFAVGRERFFVLPGRMKSHLEMHWRIATPEFPRALSNDLFARGSSAAISGHTFRTLGDEDTVLHLCHHGAHHGWERLSLVADFAASLRLLPPSRWEALLEDSRRQGLRRPLLIAMHLAHALLRVDLPERVQRAYDGDAMAQRAVRLVRSYYARASVERPDVTETVLLSLLTTERGRGALVLVANMFRPAANDYRWVHLPPKLKWLYPVLRPIRRVGSGLSVAVRLLRLPRVAEPE